MQFVLGISPIPWGSCGQKGCRAQESFGDLKSFCTVTVVFTVRYHSSAVSQAKNNIIIAKLKNAIAVNMVLQVMTTLHQGMADICGFNLSTSIN